MAINLVKCNISFIECIFSLSYCPFLIKQFQISLNKNPLNNSETISLPTEIKNLVSDIENLLGGNKDLLPIDFLDLKPLTDFQKKILFTLREKVPRGCVATYGDIAKFANNPNAVRAVGNVMSNNPFPLFFPCHRVVASGTLPGGFNAGLELKKRLLQTELSHTELIKYFRRKIDE